MNEETIESVRVVGEEEVDVEVICVKSLLNGGGKGAAVR